MKLFNTDGLNREELKEVIRLIDHIWNTGTVSREFINIQDAAEPLNDLLEAERKRVFELKRHAPKLPKKN